MPLTKWINTLKHLELNLNNGLDQDVNSMLGEFADMQRDRIDKGVNAEGERLERNTGEYYPYSPSYTKYKRAKGGKVNVVDLNLTGNFTRDIKATKVGKGKVHLWSTDYKNGILQSNYDAIFGFSPQQVEKLKEMFKQMLFKRIKTIAT